MSVRTGLGDVLPLSRLDKAAVICLVGIGKPEVSPWASPGGCWPGASLPGLSEADQWHRQWQPKTAAQCSSDAFAAASRAGGAA